MQFTYLVTYIYNKEDKVYFGSIETATNFRVKSIKDLTSIEKTYKHVKNPCIINFKLVGFNPFKIIGKESKWKFTGIKDFINFYLNDGVYTVNFMALYAFIITFPAHKHPAAFFSILLGWLFLWLTLKIWVKE